MRTLKKSLALVLVLAMMFSLAVTASADFTDAEEIAYPDEVELLVALGIIEGYPDESFGPQNTLTRAEAAIIAARLNAFFDEKATENSYTDMAGYSWANWAVAYCENAGIVNGTGAGKFEPATKLTGYMWVKMVLVSMGYDAEEYGMTGEAWQIGVTALDKVVGISGGSFDLSKEITREEACLFAYNALLATRDGNEFAVSHYTSEKGTHFHYFATEAEAIAFATAIGGEVLSGEFITSLGFEKFGLIGYEIGLGAWGDPFMGWETVDGFITKEWLDADLVLTTAVTEDQLFKAAVAAGIPYAEKPNTEDYLAIDHLFVNAEQQLDWYYEIIGVDENGDPVYDFVPYTAGYEAEKGDNGAVEFSGNGTVTKLYSTGAGLICVVVDQYIGMVTKVVDAAEHDGADAYVVIENLCDNTPDDDPGKDSYVLYNYSAKLGDVVTFNLMYWDEWYTKPNGVEDIYDYGWEICNIDTPDTVSGSVLRIDMKNTDAESDDVYNISGTDYMLSKHEGVDINGGDTAVWYVDDCGNLMYKANDIAFEYKVGFLLSYDAQNYWPGEKGHICDPYEAAETFEIYDPETKTIIKLPGVVTVSKDLTTTTFTAGGAKIDNDSAIAADGLDFDDSRFDEQTDNGLSTGLVLYLVNDKGEIFWISDEASADGKYEIRDGGTLDVRANSIYVNSASDKWMNDETVYLYATDKTAHAVTEQRVGLKNAKNQKTFGEFIFDVETKEVTYMAQFEVETVKEEKPVVETLYVYASGSYAVEDKEYWEISPIGGAPVSKTEYVVSGLYVDGVAIEPLTFKAKDMIPVFDKGYLYKIESTTLKGVTTWKVLERVERANLGVIDYIGVDGGEYFKIGEVDYHMAKDATIVRVNDADKVLAVNASLAELKALDGDIVVAFIVKDAKTGLVTDLYYFLDADIDL